MEDLKKETEKEEKANEFVVRDELAEKRSKINTIDELIAFIKDVKENYNYGYGEAPRAIAQAALAVAWYLSSDFGITGFQAGAVMWDFVRDWNFSHNECGLKMIDYDNLLYPQYGYKFDKTITERTWDIVQKAAKKKIEEDDAESNYKAHPDVRKHWEQIVAGVVPFGLHVEEN